MKVFLYFFVISFFFSTSCQSKSEIHWLSFEDGIKRAKDENKLIILDIYAQWCHWCNVMENTTYRDKEVVEMIKKYYIPIRVDAEERPDINKIYNQGGLPSTVILDKNGKVIFGGIYIPPEDMKKLLLHYTRLSKEEIEREAQRNELESNLRSDITRKMLARKKIDQSEIIKNYTYIKMVYDYQYGGIKGSPKFPEIDLPYFLMIYYVIFSDEDAKKLTVKTLDAYSNLIDKEEGGIFRYSVDEFWTQPHYEKLLKDQAKLSILYFNSYALFKNKNFLEYANQLINFTKKKLYDEKSGYFYNSQGADIIDEKGTILMKGEDYFSKDLEGRKIIERTLGYSPNIEKNIYYGTNALFADALLYSYIFNNSKEDFKLATKLIQKLTKEAFTEKGIIHSNRIKAFYLSNQVYFLQLLLDYYQTTGDLQYLKIAENLFNTLQKYYYSKEIGLYVDYGETSFNINKISFIDNIYELNSQLSFSLYKLSVFTGKEMYFKSMENIVEKLPIKGNLSTALSYFMYLYQPITTHIAGYTKDKEISVKKLFSIFPYYHYIQFVEYKDKKFIEDLGYPFVDKTVFYLCNYRICFKKVENLDDIEKNIWQIYKNYKNATALE